MTRYGLRNLILVLALGTLVCPLVAQESEQDRLPENNDQPLDSELQEQSGPEINFEYLWTKFDESYALFDQKNINWQLIYDVYRPKVAPQTSDDELFEIMSSMLGLLNDFHVTLMSKDFTRLYRSGRSTEIMWARFGNLKDFYQYVGKRPLTETYARSEIHEKDNLAYAWVAENIGYFHISSFQDEDKSSEAIDEIVGYFKDANSLIIDVRRNVGGDDDVGKTIADRFADRKRLYMISQTKNGPKPDDLSQRKEWYVEPTGKLQYTNPVILLTDLYSMSAAENFALAMRVLPHATLVGDFTAGVHGDTETDTLPNGWEFRVSTGVFTDQNGFCWEGIGIPPDFRIANTQEDDANGKDRVLEFAIDLINARSSEKSN